MCMLSVVLKPDALNTLKGKTGHQILSPSIITGFYPCSTIQKTLRHDLQFIKSIW